MAHIDEANSEIVISARAIAQILVTDTQGSPVSSETLYVEEVEVFDELKMTTWKGATPAGVSFRMTFEYGDLEVR